MSYIWEYYSKDNRFVMELLSPYFEAVNSNKICCVNPLLRFASINSSFSSIDDSELVDLKRINRSKIENVVFHILALLDIESGLDEKQIKMNFLDKEIMTGQFGDKIKGLWADLLLKDKNIILSQLTDDKPLEDIFYSVLIKLFSEISLCYEEQCSTYYLYIADKKTAYREKLVEVIKFFCWPIKKSLLTFWRYHYGITGFDKSMKIDNIAIV